jgi:hypothetical protein
MIEYKSVNLKTHTKLGSGELLAVAAAHYAFLPGQELEDALLQGFHRGD